MSRYCEHKIIIIIIANTKKTDKFGNNKSLMIFKNR